MCDIDSVAPIMTLSKTADDRYFIANLTEPVQFVPSTDEEISSGTPERKNIETFTYNEEQVNQPVVVTIKGKDAEGTDCTINAKAITYAENDKKTDTKVLIYAVDKVTGKTLQQLVNEGYGQNWKFIVDNIGDDVGRAAASPAEDFIITPAEGAFAIDQPEGITGITNSSVQKIKKDEKVVHVKGLTDEQVKTVLTRENTQNDDVIFVTFTKGVSDVGNIVENTTWSLDGEVFPVGTKIKVVKESGNDKVGYKTIMILIGKTPTLALAKSHVLTIDKTAKSFTGTLLTGEYENKFIGK